MAEPTERVVPVVIQGQRYPIRSSLDPRYIVELAAYVEEKMQTAADRGAVTDSLRLAVLAALNIADEVFRCREAAQSHSREVADRARAIEQMLDAALETPLR
ncbi:MAG TPA: cell division protein ZapA [Vicinamibacterales bacterium]|nr:cell division protein ZapA [Vicinamibacterales bacterium]